jgi:ATP-binding cassette subfamily A (ABC1) protein 3
MAFLAGYILYALFGSTTSSSSSARGVCLFSPACFGSSILTLSELEKAQLGVNRVTAQTIVYNISHAQTIGFYFLDILLYMFFTWYLDKVLPSEYGTKRPWYFLFQKRFWCRDSIPKGYSTVNDEFAKLTDANIPEMYEKVSSEMENLNGVKVRKIIKEFSIPQKSSFRAVNEVSLDMFEGEVFSLLGHNGAGK